jgi:hypothetical protein
MWSELFALWSIVAYGITADPLPEDADGVTFKWQIWRGALLLRIVVAAVFSYWIPVTSTIFSNRKLAQIFPHADSFQAKFFTCVISSRNEIEFIAKKLNQNSLEHFAEEFLFLRGEFFALGGQIEHIDGFVPFRIDQRDLDIASQPRQR